MALILLLLACTRPVAEPSSADPIEIERQALHAAELELLRGEATRRLDGGDLLGALTPVVAAEPLGGLPPERARLSALAEERDPAVAAALHEALAEAIRSDPERSEAHATRARELGSKAELRARYAQDAVAASRARVEGVDRATLEAVIRRAANGHVRPPEPAVMARAGAVRLGDLTTDPGARAAFPALAELQAIAAAATASEPAELDEAIAAGRALVDAGVALGLPADLLVSEWVDGALSSFDRWTRVAWPAELAAFEAHHSGIEVGVGLEVEAASGAVYASLPMPGGPAWRAGVHRGDRLIAIIEGPSRTEVTEPDMARGALRGRPDSALTLVLSRGEQPLELEMTREPVRRQTVHGWTMDAENHPLFAMPAVAGTGYARIEAFRPYTDEELAEGLASAGDLRALVLDLRGNGGGDVQAAANAVDLFAAEGVVATLEGPGAPPPPGEGEIAWNALVPGGAFEELELVVLIDRDTASAAELMAGALAEREHTTLIGERTWGKGWSQGLVVDEARGFALSVTNAAWRLPSGRMLQRVPGSASWGVEPDVELVASAAETWQNQARRRTLEFPKTHADGTPMHPPEHGQHEGLPVLTEDPAIHRALALLQASAPPQEDPDPAVQPKQ